MPAGHQHRAVHIDSGTFDMVVQDGCGDDLVTNVSTV